MGCTCGAERGKVRHWRLWGLQMRECFAVLNLCKKMMRGEKTKKLDKCGRCLFGWTECLDNDMPLIDSTQHVGI